MNIGAFTATLGLDVSDYSRGILDAQALNAIFGNSFAQFVANPLLGGIALLKDAAAGVFDLAQQSAEYAERITRVSEEANVSATTLQVLREVLADNGLAAEGAEAALQRFNVRIGDLRREGGPTARALADVGVNIDKLGDGDEALRTVIDGLARIDNASVRASLAMDLFDRQYGRAIANAVRNAGGIAELERGFGGLIVSTDRLKAGLEFDEQADRLGNALETIKRALAFEALDAFSDGFGRGRDVVGQTSEVIRDLTPVVRDASQALGELATNLGTVGNAAKTSFDTLANSKDFLLLLSGSFADWYSAEEGTGAQMANDAFMRLRDRNDLYLNNRDKVEYRRSRPQP